MLDGTLAFEYFGVDRVDTVAGEEECSELGKESELVGHIIAHNEPDFRPCKK